LARIGVDGGADDGADDTCSAIEPCSDEREKYGHRSLALDLLSNKSHAKPQEDNILGFRPRRQRGPGHLTSVRKAGNELKRNNRTEGGHIETLVHACDNAPSMAVTTDCCRE
jgi:hypothetical protein